MLELEPQRWREIEELMNRIDKSGFSKVNSHEIMRLGELYVDLLSDLNKLKAANGDFSLRKRANRIALRAYGIIYHHRSMGVTDLLKFFLCEFPALIMKRIHFIVASMLIFLIAAMVGYICIHEKSRLLDLVVPPVEQQRVKTAIATLDTNKPHPATREAGFGLSSTIMTNNIRVSILAFALGIFFGVGTIAILVTNGLLIGGLAALYHEGGLAGHFWSLILPHGGIELLCIFICGGAGLIIGYALINPGSFHRKDWLVREGMDAVKLLIGTIPLLVVAGLIEAYVTPAYLSIPLKLVISAVILGLTLTGLAIGSQRQLKLVA